MIQNLSRPVKSCHWPFSRDCSKIRGQYRGPTTKTLYQWLYQRASFFHPARGSSRTIRTELMVKQQGMTLLLDGAATRAFDICPLCGQKLAGAQADHAIALFQSEEPNSAASRKDT